MFSGQLTIKGVFFPKLDQTVTFVLCVTFLSLFVVDGQCRDYAKDIAHGIVTYAPSEGSDTGIGDFFGVLWAIVLVVTALIAPLFLPFTDYNLRPFLVGIVLIDAFLLFGGNLYQFLEHGGYVNIILAGYYFCWATYICEKSSAIFTTDGVKSRESLITAGVSVVILAVLIYLFEMHWLNAYSAAVISSCYMYGLFRTLVSQRPVV